MDNDDSEGGIFSPDPEVDLALFAAISEEEGWDRRPAPSGCCGCAFIVGVAALCIPLLCLRLK